MYTLLFVIKKNKQKIIFNSTKTAMCFCAWLLLTERATNQPCQLVAKGQEGSFLADVELYHCNIALQKHRYISLFLATIIFP